jgi:exopolyphosphatase/guanosine-5'-triphosphate,3'-diphosphate pyrophosphatase
MLIRVVDIGSNSVKAALYDVENQSHKPVSKDKLHFSIGEDVFSQGYIGEDSQEKVAKYIEGLPSSSGGEKIHFTFVMATSAVRSARNRDAFARKLQQRTGLPCRVLSGEEESFLIHMGIASKAGIGPSETIKTIDIGGGSAEISWSRGLAYLFGHSYDLGAIRLSKRFLKGKTFTREGFEQIEGLALSVLKTGAKEKAPPEADRAIGSSGNIRAIAKSLAGVRNPAFSKLIPEITLGSLEDLVELSIGKEPKQLSDIFNGLPAERARIIMPAVVVLLSCMRFFGINRLGVSEAGLREGVAYFWSRNGHLNLPVSSGASGEGRA